MLFLNKIEKCRNTWRCPVFPNGKSRPTKGMRLCPHGSWLKKHNFCLFEGSQEHSSGSHRVTVQKPLGERRRGLQGNDHDCWESSRCLGGGRGVTDHSPSCPDGEVLTQEPEEVRWPVLPQAGVSPVLGCLSQGVVPHLNTKRHGGDMETHYITDGK